MPKFLIYSFSVHFLLFLIIKIDFKPSPQLKKKETVSVAMIEKKELKTKKKVVKKIKPPNKEKKPSNAIRKKEKRKEKKTNKKVLPLKKNKPQKEINKNLEVFDDMLKNLAKEELIDKKKVGQEKEFQKTLDNLASKDLFLTNKGPQKRELKLIENIILKQVNENWSRPPGIKTSENLTVKLIIYLNINGEVIDLKIHSETKEMIKENKFIKPYLDSALRAIKKSSPFEGLKKDRYNIWKIVIINFKPKEAM